MNTQPAIRYVIPLLLLLSTPTIAPAAQVMLPGTTPLADWWHGCSPTAAGMLVGYYDINGYQGRYYGDLVPGGVSESTMVGTADHRRGDDDWYPGENYPYPTTRLARTIASREHIEDYWESYKSTTPDEDLIAARGIRSAAHEPNSLADFMGTSQNGVSDGGTYFWPMGSGRTTTTDLYNFEVPGQTTPLHEKSGAYGVFEYLRYAGYEDAASVGTARIYNQETNNTIGATGGGFTFDGFQAEIDAGRPVLVHVTGHTMLGVGYDADAGTITVHNTWTYIGGGIGTMNWGGHYGPETMVMESVTVVELDTAYGAAMAEGGTARFEYLADGSSLAGGAADGLTGPALTSGLLVDHLDGGEDDWLSIKYFYCDEELAEAGIADELDLRLFLWDDLADSWLMGGDGLFHLGLPQGGLGDFGLCPDENYAWINVDDRASWRLAAIPEPATLGLLSLGGLAILRRRKGMRS